MGEGAGNSILVAATLLAALGAGLVAGVFFAFSGFVMGALARLPAAQGIAAMQSINIVVINPAFLGPFFGTGALGLALGIYALVEGGTAWPLAGALLYCIGTIGVTALGNVPRNNRLARVAPDDPDSVEIWSRYVVEWTWWNHVRTAAAMFAAACFMLALV